MDKDHTGIVVEEALDDNLLINSLAVQSVRITGHKRRQDRWHLYEVKVSLDEIDQLAKHVTDNWYIHFWKDSKIVALFKDHRFEFDYDIAETWKEVLEYGRSIGIPDEQLDFPIQGL
ncbi:MAG TPA: hypothetical protein VN512_00200 [Clostridia bacterium]|nr:hypothetical protein [Clostridia bacterium]